MYKALVLKELRETMGITILALLAYFVGIVCLTGYKVLPFLPEPGLREIPFLGGNKYGWLMVVSAVVFAMALGLWQTLGESIHGTWQYLLHRPMDMRKLIGVKLAVGGGLYLVVSALAILVYAAWPATPGTHASPFYWWMTVPVWKGWLLILLCYLCTFLAGIRPGRWIGTRLMPIAAIYLLAVFISIIPDWWTMVDLGLPALIVVCVFLVYLIFHIARTRDFS
ncbi:MAG TPA: hypothetical protein VIH42_08455 [Thermoguttaceae bacterium]